MRRVLPAITLFFVAPLVSEFLLGDLPLKLLGALVVLAPLYGGGALLVRELVRRSGRGWPSILMLAFAYAVIEEAFTTQTLFNPDYLHMKMGLLKPAYIPALGMGAWWTVFVLTLHTVWSISVSIGLTEALFPDRATTPWLKNLGLTITTVLLLLGATASTLLEIKQDHYISSTWQFVGAGVVCVIAIVVAFRLPKTSSSRRPGWVPNPWLVGIIALAAGSIFMVVPNVWGWKAVGIYLAMDLLLIVAVTSWSYRTGWNGLHRLALAGGAALAYAWHAFIQTPVVKGSLDHRVGNAIFAIALLIVLVIASKRTAALVALE